MEKITYTADNQRIIERFLLIIYTIYCIGIMVFFAEYSMGGWINFFQLLFLMLNWFLYIGKVNTYAFRAKISAIVMQLGIIVYAVNVNDLSLVYPIFCTFIILLGLYGIPDIIFVTTVSIAIILGYHGLILGTIPVGNTNEVMKLVLQVGNIILLEYIMYIWTKRNSDGSDRLLEAIEELKMAEESKNDFLANVSHEIRTPINTICGMSELVLRSELPYGVNEKIKDIQRSGHDLMMVVRDILDFSELQSGKIELEEEAYNISSTINDVIQMAISRKKDKKIELIVDCDAGIPSVLLGDEKKLRRIMTNMVDNAIKFTETGCVVIKINYRRETYGINLSVTIKDTGIGMDEQSLEKMFVSFNQVDASRKRHEGGVGLGLAISHALVQKMGGAITVKSKLGKGTAVRFVVPQKVLDETPIASIENRDINVATYIDMEQFDMMEIRDEYTNNILHMVEQLKAKCQICRNLSELKRREEKEKFSHIFISMVEYREAKEYFDALAEETNVIVVLDYYDDRDVTNPYLLKVYKPFYILTIVAVINSMEHSAEKNTTGNAEKITTKDAHVLVVDDNRTNIRVIEGLLSYYNVKVTVAESGEEALEKIASADYDFVFMDHMMPDMDGVETMLKIRHKVGTYYQKVPIVALTANAVAGTREKLLAKGFNDFLEKPVERSVLERVLKRNLPPEKIIYKKECEMNDISEVTENAEEALIDAGLDVQKGILYCNGKERYLAVLQGYCSDYQKIGLPADALFEKQDWENYTIVVHGIKSAMYSIGALRISEYAKTLEMAGRNGNIEYIIENHKRFSEEYHDMLKRLCKRELFGNVCTEDGESANEPETMAEVRETKNIEPEDFEAKIADMEAAVFALEQEKMLQIVAELENCKYGGTSLKEYMITARKKVEMSDYMSALEMVIKTKKKLSDGER